MVGLDLGPDVSFVNLVAETGGLFSGATWEGSDSLSLYVLWSVHVAHWLPFLDYAATLIFYCLDVVGGNKKVGAQANLIVVPQILFAYRTISRGAMS